MVKDRRHYYSIMMVLILLLIPVLMYAKYYISGQTLGGADFFQYFATKKYMGECILNGKYSQWNQYLQGGMPQAGVCDFYLIGTLLSLLPFKEYIYIYYIVHLFLAGLFFYLYLRECGCSCLPSYVMAVVFECSIQINGMRKGHPTIVAAICLFPLVMYCVRKFLNGTNPKWLYLSAVSAGVLSTAGIQMGIYADIILAVYLLFMGIKNRYPIGYIIKQGAFWILFYIGSFAYMLLPTLHMMREYSANGASDTAFETFCSWSIHPVKILQMVYPKIFGEIYQAFGNMYSSEMDIEIYLGIFILLLAVGISAVRFHSVSVKIDVLCALAAFGYAMVAHIPFVNQMVYHLPVLGGFRCPARILYLFYFFVLSLAGKGLHSLCTVGEHDLNINCIRKMALALWKVTIVLFITAVFVISILEKPGDRVADCYQIKEILTVPFLVLSGIIAFTLLYQRKMKGLGQGWGKKAVCIVVLGITLTEVLPYSMVTNAMDLGQLELQDGFVQKLCEGVGDYKVWDAFEGIDGAHQSLVAQNKGMINKIPSINAYTAFNNPLLCRYLKNLGEEVEDFPFNYSGLMTGSLNAFNNVVFQNGLLSMLGVKYLIDSSKVIEDTDGRTYDISKPGESLVSQEDITINTDGGIVGVYEIMGGIEADAAYNIEFRLDEIDKNKISFLAVDLYGGEHYDQARQEVQFDPAQDGDVYRACIYSGKTDSATQEVVMRFLVCADGESVDIDQCRVSSVSTEEAYVLFGSDSNGTRVYENKNANPILYFPDRLEKISDLEDIYVNSVFYDLGNAAYTDRESCILGNGDKKIDNISFTGECLRADIYTGENSYLCFSQSYSKDWKVRIDGTEQDVDLVNGLIMGIPVPAGSHSIEFQYNDRSYFFGNIISGITFITLVFLWKKSARKIN